MSSRIYWPSLSAPGSLPSIAMSERSSLQEPGGHWHPTIHLRVPERVQRYVSRFVFIGKDQIWWGSLDDSILINWNSLFHLQAKTAPSLMPVPQVPVPMVLVVPIGITTTTVPAHLASRERTAATTLMSAASLACASMAAFALTPTGPSAASASLDTVDAHVRCPFFPVPHHSVLMGAPVDRPVTIPMSVLAYQVQRLSVSLIEHTCRHTKQLKSVYRSYSLHRLLELGYRHTDFPRLMT